MFRKLDEVVDRFREVEGLLADPKVMADQEKFRALTREHADLSEVVETYGDYRKVVEEVEGNRELLRDSDPELRELAKAELPELETRQEKLEKQLTLLLLPKRYITAEDVGISLADMVAVSQRTQYVSGLPVPGGTAGGDPGPFTAMGIYHGIKAAVAWKLGKAEDSLPAGGSVLLPPPPYRSTNSLVSVHRL